METIRHSSKDLALRMLNGMFEASGRTPTPDVAQFLSQYLATTFDECFGRVALPSDGESCVVSLENPKTAALFFDRIWMIGRPDGRVADVTFTGGTSLEIWVGALTAASSADGPDGEAIFPNVASLLADSPLEEAFKRMSGSVDAPAVARMIAQNLYEERGIRSVPMFSSAASQDEAYAVGDRRALLASVNNLGVIDEVALTWEQVLEVRDDAEATKKLRSLRHWADSAMAGKSIGFVTDAIGVRLDDYEWSLKKHGIKTLLGSMRSILDPRFLTASAGLGAAVGFTAGPHVGLGLLGITVLGKTALAIGEASLDLADAKHGEGAEVAFLYEIQKLSS